MASTRTRNLARAIQRANPDMKYTEALRHAEAGRIVFDPKGPHSSMLDMYRAAGMTTEQSPLPDTGEALAPAHVAAAEPVEALPEPHDLAPLLWDGEVHPDLLTFFVGQNLRTEKKRYLRLNATSPHVMISGGPATGKTAVAEMIAAQVLTKSMPWDRGLRGTAVFVDPKGPLARRWAGRPGAIVANGRENAAEPDANGDPVTGPVVMASAMEWVEAEHRRRAVILARYERAASWLDLPDGVKRAEGLAPVIVILDECLDHVDLATGDSEYAQRENRAREVVTILAEWHARKYRTVGMHTVLISQKARLDSPLLWNIPARIMTDQVGHSELTSAFRGEGVPELLSTREGGEGGEAETQRIPGRAWIMDALGQRIDTIQIPWFGGRAKSEILDKWLPRGVVPPNGDFTRPAGKPLRAR